MTAFTLLVLALPLSAADAPADAKNDLDKLQGAWSIAGGTYDGEDLNADVVAKLTVEIKGDQFAVKGDEEVVKEYTKITLKLSPSSSPKAIDFHVGQGSEKGADIEGIYEIKGDEFKICARIDAKERPTEFKSPENSHVALITFKRLSK